MHRLFKFLELFLLFIVIPGILATTLYAPIKIGAVVMALLYVLALTYKNRANLNFSISFKKPSKPYIVRVLLLSVLLILLGVILINFINADLLFTVVKSKPKLWVVILFVYAFLSVIPQELVYRSFFYFRYRSLFANKKLFSIVNVVCFSWCHVFLNNIWVMLITALAGILFVYTYEKEKSLFWTVVEHSLYGNLVFTLGLGEMLAFPT